MRKFALSLVAVFLITGCSFKPETPMIDTTYKNSLNAVVIKDKWWQDFGDPGLNSVVERVLRYNTNLRLAYNSVDIARANLGLSKLDLLPNIGYSGSAGRQNNYPTGMTDANPSTIYSAAATLSYEFDIWGKIRNNINANEATFKATQFDYEAARLSLISTTVSTYLQYKMLLAQKAILEDTLKSYQSSLNFRKNQLEAGVINPTVVHQMQSEVQSVKVQIAQVSDSIAATNSALMVMSGSSFDEILYGYVTTTSKSFIAPKVPANVPSNILQKRPDVASAIENLKAANYNVGVAKANYFPSFSLTGALGFGSTEFDRLFTGGGTWSLVAGVTGPLIDFGRTATGVELANLSQKQAFIAYEDVLRTTFGEVRSALESKKYAEQYAKSAAALLSSQQQVYNTASQQYNEGYSSFLELLDAQRQLLSARLSNLQAKYQNANSSVAVYKALGGGFVLYDEEDRNISKSNETIQPDMSLSPF